MKVKGIGTASLAIVVVIAVVAIGAGYYVLAGTGEDGGENGGDGGDGGDGGGDGVTTQLTFADLESAGTNLGGNAGPMSPDESWDPTCEFVSGHDGLALSLQYNFPSGQWCGYWMKFLADESGYDVSSYTHLRMWVKGATGGETFKVEVADEIYDSGNYEATQYHKSAVSITTASGFGSGATTSWQELVMPLSSFTSGTDVDLTKLAQICIVFDTSPTQGTVYIDQIRFTA